MPELVPGDRLQLAIVAIDVVGEAGPEEQD